MFAVFIDSFDTVISKLRTTGYSSYDGKFYFGCLLYADNILLAYHSLEALQLMQDIIARRKLNRLFSFSTRK